MSFRVFVRCFFAIACFSYSAQAFAEIKWVDFSDDVFLRAKTEHKLVLLDLEAVWCHWCHVMEKETYGNPNVQVVVNANYIAVKADQDARPDLSARYGDYGWPATIILNATGEDLVKRAGYIEARDMTKLLLQTAKSPKLSSDKDFEVVKLNVAKSDGLSADVKEKLEFRYHKKSDYEVGGMYGSQRYLDSDSIEYALLQASAGDAHERAYAELSLKQNLKLIDPAWGGVYQYSTDADWDHPHFEKIVPYQASDIELYGFAYSLWKNPADFDAAKAIVRFVNAFLLSPEGAFYTSQDADVVRGVHSGEYFRLDDAGRRRVGIPAVDKHEYSESNGYLIKAFADLYANGGEDSLLSTAKRAADWIVSNRRYGDGFSHDARDVAGPYLADSAAMGSAALALYETTADRKWLNVARDAAKFVGRKFLVPGEEGFASVAVSGGFGNPIRLIDQNVRVARFLNLLSHYTGSEDEEALAKNAVRWLSDPKIALSYSTQPGILLADFELHSSPLHITIIGSKSDALAAALFRAALAQPSNYKMIEWWDKSEGELPNKKVEFPSLSKSAAFVCTSSRCSLPIFEPAKIGETIATFAAQK